MHTRQVFGRDNFRLSRAKGVGLKLMVGHLPHFGLIPFLLAVTLVTREIPACLLQLGAGIAGTRHINQP